MTISTCTMSITVAAGIRSQERGDLWAFEA